MKPDIKVCGVNDEAIAEEAVRLGASYIGMVFAEGSPRCVSAEKAHSVARAARAASSGLSPAIVGVFVSHSIDAILEIARSVPLDVVQLHSGSYGTADISRLKAEGFEVWLLASKVDCAGCGADAILLDGRAGGKCGGTGRLADWSLVGPLKAAGLRVVLAGGMSAANFASAASTLADVIDVNSSLETSPGVKSIGLLREFFRSAGRVA